VGPLEAIKRSVRATSPSGREASACSLGFTVSMRCEQHMEPLHSGTAYPKAHPAVGDYSPVAGK